MSYKTEFPDYDGKLFLPTGFIDNSWRNDAMPRATRLIKDGRSYTEYNIWQDYISEDLREYEGLGRYGFEINVDGETVFDFKTDDLNKIKDLLKGITL